MPLPTGGATHLFEIIATLVALQLVAGRDKIWLPARWCKLDLGTGGGRTRFIRGLMKVIPRIERFSRPRCRSLFDHRASNAVFGLFVIAGSLGAFFAPPFTGLDTLPALGVVLLSLGVLLEDFAVRRAGRREPLLAACSTPTDRWSVRHARCMEPAQRITGRPPRTVPAFLHEHRAEFV